MKLRRSHVFFSLLLALAQGEAARAERWIRYEDFTTSGRTRSNRGLPLPQPVRCGDETRRALPLRADDEVFAPLEVGGAATLVVAGCRTGSPPGSAGEPARLEIRFEPAAEGEAAPVVRLPLPKRGIWWSWTLDWSALAGRVGKLRLRAVLPGGGAFHLRELHLRHEPTAPSAAADREEPTQVLLVSVDTLRADGIGALGGPWTTPALDRLVAESQIWTRHYAAASWTKPSHASLLTGFSPIVHGATRFPSSIHPRLRTLADRFHDAGFATAGLVYHCVLLNSEFGFDRGFDQYRSVFWELPQMARATSNWIGDRRAEPFFYFLHTYEVHSDPRLLPYEGPRASRRAVRERFGVENYGCRGKLCATERLARIGKGELAPLPEEGAILRFLYGAGVEHVDRVLGALFDDLRAMGLYERMLIIVTSDHGEAFLAPMRDSCRSGDGRGRP